MRLYLSSENFGKHQDSLVMLTRGNHTVAYIANAGDYKSVEERQTKVKEHKQQFLDLGFKFTEIDLRDYFSGKSGKDIFKGFGLVWCAGGNTFLLRSALYKSGQDKVLKRMIENDEIAYGGSSAGSIVVGPTLRGTEHGDDPSAVRQIYKLNTLTDGLNIVPFVSIPHWGSEWFGESAIKMRDQLDNNHTPFRILNDGEVYLIDGEKQELLK